MIASIRDSVKVGAIVGVIAGAITVVYSLIASLVLHEGFFTPLYAAASPIFGQHDTFTSLFKDFYVSVGGIIVGLIFDLVGSALFGIVFVLLWRLAALDRRWAIPVGVLYGLVVMGFMAVIVFPLSGAGFTMDREGWSYLIEHVIFGLVFGLWAMSLARGIPVRRRRPAPVSVEDREELLEADEAV